MTGASHAHLHAADEPELVSVPAITYASVLGAGSPGTDEFYRKKSLIGDVARRLGGGGEPVIEIHYWYPDGSAPVEIADFYTVNPVSSLQYRVLAAVPDQTPENAITSARAESPFAREGDDVSSFESPAQLVVQVMHHGPFAEEYATLDRLGAFAHARGLRRSGPHREVHLDAFERSTAQDSLRTILRDPVS